MPADIRAAAVTIAAFNSADTSAVQESYDILSAARAHDVPDFPPLCPYRHRMAIQVPWPDSRVLRYLARDGDRAVGYLSVELPTKDNLDNAFLEIVVPPALRRNGFGRALYEHAVVVARAEGRKRLFADSVTTLDGGAARDGAGSAFAAAIGAQDALHDVRRRLDVSTVDWLALDGLLAQAWQRADGYSLVRWVDRTPEEYVDDVALLGSRLIQDAPMGDLAIEPETIDAKRQRASEEIRLAHGVRTFATATRHDATGRLVGLSELQQQYSHVEHAGQGITLVHPAHRGHRLGTIVKLENLRYALPELPGLRYIDTWNAAVNDYMISINEAMGFRPVDGWIDWQQEI